MYNHLIMTTILFLMPNPKTPEVWAKSQKVNLWATNTKFS